MQCGLGYCTTWEVQIHSITLHLVDFFILLHYVNSVIQHNKRVWLSSESWEMLKAIDNIEAM